MAPDTEKEPIRLIPKIVQKDREAFERFYDLLAPLAFSLIVRIVKSRSDAEELLQDVFYYVWEKSANFNPDRGTPQAWVLTIARSRAIDRLRARKSRPQTAEPLDGESEDWRFADSRSQQVLEARDMRAALETQLAGLSEIQREALELAYFEGLTQSEIAQKLELPLGTVKTRLRDGLIKLREILEKKNMGQLK